MKWLVNEISREQGRLCLVEMRDRVAGASGIHGRWGCWGALMAVEVHHFDLHSREASVGRVDGR